MSDGEASAPMHADAGRNAAAQSSIDVFSNAGRRIGAGPTFVRSPAWSSSPTAVTDSHADASGGHKSGWDDVD